jgi:hypothetical protein
LLQLTTRPTASILVIKAALLLALHDIENYASRSFPNILLLDCTLSKVLGLSMRCGTPRIRVWRTVDEI